MHVGGMALLYLGVTVYWAGCAYCSMWALPVLFGWQTYFALRCLLVIGSVVLFVRYILRPSTGRFWAQEVPKLILSVDYGLSVGWGEYYGP